MGRCHFWRPSSIPCDYEIRKVSKDPVYQFTQHGCCLDGTVEAMEDFKQESGIRFKF